MLPARPPAPPVDTDEDEGSIPEEELDTPVDDGDEGEAVADEVEDQGDDDLDDLDDGGDDPRDDLGSEAIETDDDLDPVDEHEEQEGDAEIDVGPLDEGLGLDENDGPGDDAGSAADQGEEGDDLDIDEHDELDDGGAEGTGDDPSDEVDEAALPELDADEEGEEGDEELSDILLGDAGEAAPIAWAEARWSPIDGAGAALPVRALAFEGGRLAAAGERLLLVDEGALAARLASFGAGSTAVALTGALLLVAGPRAQLSLSTDGGEKSSPLPGFSAAALPIDLAATPGRIWLRADGALFCLGAADQPPAVLRDRGVLAMSTSGAALIVLRRSAAGPSLDRLRGDDEGWQETALRGSIRRRIERARRGLLLAASAGGRALALCDGAAVAVSRDGGKQFDTHELGAINALCFAGDDEAAPLLLLASTPDAAPGEAALLRLLPGGELSRLATVAGAAAGPASMVWDATRDALWIACESGLLALARPSSH
jgi:hypothetical protein